MTLSLMFAAATAVAAAPPGQAEMIRIADAFDRAQLAQDQPALEAFVDDRLVFIESSGKRSGKKEFIDGWMGAGVKYDAIMLIDRVVTPLGSDAFIVSAETTLSGSSEGKPFSSRFRFSDTFRRQDGHWRAVHIQVTRIGN